MLGARSLADWELDVLVELGFRMDDPRSSARADYLAVAETWDAFGTTAFQGAVVEPAAWAGGCVLEVGRDGVRVLEGVADRARGGGLLRARAVARWAAAPATGDVSAAPATGDVSLLTLNWCAPSCGEEAPRCIACTFRLSGAAAAHDAVALLDDYSTLDWAEDPPAHRYARDSGNGSGSPPPASTLSALYDSLVYAVIRPPRSLYDIRSPWAARISAGVSRAPLSMRAEGMSRARYP